MLLRHKRLSWFCRFIAGASLLFLCSCGSGSDDITGTGAITFNMEWKSETTARSDFTLSANGDVCDNYLISTINATIYDATDKNIASKSFGCAEHSGSFPGIPAGSGYRLVIKGMVSGNPDWTGQANGLSVTDGKTTDAGLIAMTYSGSDTTGPTVVEVFPDATIVGISLKPTVSAKFNEPMAGSSITASSFTLIKASDSTIITGQITYDRTSLTAAFIPDADLEPSTKYVATLTTDIKDIAGNSFDGDLTTEVAENYAWTFVTGAFIPGCTYTLSPPSLSIIFFSPSSSRTVSVKASDPMCTWNATSNASWLSIVSGSSGTGDGTVEYQVSENTSASDRTGTLTIADKTLTIQQKAAGDTFPVLIWDAGSWDEVVWQ